MLILALSMGAGCVEVSGLYGVGLCRGVRRLRHVALCWLYWLCFLLSPPSLVLLVFRFLLVFISCGACTDLLALTLQNHHNVRSDSFSFRPFPILHFPFLSFRLGFFLRSGLPTFLLCGLAFGSRSSVYEPS
jgi:hypothetical protein